MQINLRHFKDFSDLREHPATLRKKGGGVCGTESFWVVLTQELEVLAILNGSAKHFHPLKGGVQKVLTS